MTRLEQILTDLVAEIRALGVRLDGMERTVAGCQQARATSAAVAESERTAEVARSERAWSRLVQVASAWPVRYALTGIVGIAILALADRCGISPSLVSWWPGGPTP